MVGARGVDARLTSSSYDFNPAWKRGSPWSSRTRHHFLRLSGQRDPRRSHHWLTRDCGILTVQWWQRSLSTGLDLAGYQKYSQLRMIRASADDYLSPVEAGHRLDVTPRRIYQLVAHGLLRAERVGGRLLIHREDVDARVGLEIKSGRPFSPRRAWGLLLLAAGQDPHQLDSATRSKLRRLLRERSVWSLRSRLGSRAARHAVRAHSSDLPKIMAEAGAIPTGARYAAEAGLNLIAPNALLELYVTGNVARKLGMKYRLEESKDANLVLRVLPVSVEGWLTGNLAPRPAVALDVAESGDSRSRQVARLALGG